MRTRTKVISLTMALSMFIMVTVGCNDNKSTSSMVSANASSSNSISIKNESYEDVVEDMGGYEFTVASAWLRNTVPRDGTTFERLWHQRKDEVEKAYNCKITIVSFYASMEGMIPKIMAGDKVADVVQMIGDMWLPSAGAGYLRPWDDVSDIIHLNDNRWIPDYNATVLNGKHFVLSFERPGDVGTILWYNKDLLKQAGITEDPAQLVKDGTWTWDKFREMLKSTTMDTNKDGVMDKYGIFSNNGYSDIGFALAASNNANMLTSVEGKFTATYGSPNFINAINFYDTLVNTDKTVKKYDNMNTPETWNNMPTSDTFFNEFRNGNVAFLSGRLWYGNQQLKPFIENFKYGMVLFPKGPLAKDYICDGQVTGGFVLTSTNKDYIKSAKIFNALARPVKGYEDDTAMAETIKTNFFQDDDNLSYEMYQLAMSKLRIDLGYGVQTMTTSVNHAIINSVFWKYDTPTAAIESLKDLYNEDIANIYAKLPK